MRRLHRVRHPLVLIFLGLLLISQVLVLILPVLLQVLWPRKLARVGGGSRGGAPLAHVYLDGQKRKNVPRARRVAGGDAYAGARMLTDADVC